MILVLDSNLNYRRLLTRMNGKDIVKMFYT